MTHATGVALCVLAKLHLRGSSRTRRDAWCDVRGVRGTSTHHSDVARRRGVVVAQKFPRRCALVNSWRRVLLVWLHRWLWLTLWLLLHRMVHSMVFCLVLLVWAGRCRCRASVCATATVTATATALASRRGWILALRPIQAVVELIIIVVVVIVVVMVVAVSSNTPGCCLLSSCT